MTVLIVEDEMPAVERLQKLLQEATRNAGRRHFGQHPGNGAVAANPCGTRPGFNGH